MTDPQGAVTTGGEERLDDLWDAYAQAVEEGSTMWKAEWRKRIEKRLAAPPSSSKVPTDGLRAALRARLLQMANVAAEKRPVTDVARGYERACDELLEWLASKGERE